MKYATVSTEHISLIYTPGIYIIERTDRVTVLHIENLTKPLYLVPQKIFIYIDSMKVYLILLFNYISLLTTSQAWCGLYCINVSFKLKDSDQKHFKIILLAWESILYWVVIIYVVGSDQGSDQEDGIKIKIEKEKISPTCARISNPTKHRM